MHIEKNLFGLKWLKLALVKLGGMWDPETDPNSLFLEVDPWIRIRIHIEIKRIRYTGWIYILYPMRELCDKYSIHLYLFQATLERVF